MSENYGELLDSKDRKNASSVMEEDLYKEESILKDRLFSRTIKKLLDSSTTLLYGPQITLPNNMAPFLYFYDSISIQICPHCPQAKNPSLLKPFLDRGLISVFMIGNFSEAPRDFQKLAFDYSDYFVGPASYYQYRYFKTNVHPFHSDPHEHYCAECIKEKIQPHLTSLDKMQTDIQYTMKKTLNGIMNTPSPTANALVDFFIETLKNPNMNSAHELETATQLSFYLSAAKSLDATPQLEIDMLGESNLLLEGLRIDHSQDIDLKDYLDLIRDFRGKLSPTLIPKDKNQILNVVGKINDEVNKIKSSNRLPLATFASIFTTKIPTLLSLVLTHGSFGGEGVLDLPPPSFKSRRLSQFKTKVLSQYFGVSEAGIQVWKIRDGLEKSQKRRRS